MTTDWREQMDSKNWIRLDNASNIFLAAQNEIDTKVFRMTMEFTETIEPSLLQSALNNIYEEYPLFHNVLRRGVFWYYLEESDINPRVQPELEAPMTAIYETGQKDFLFRVLYKENRVHLEVYHALTDGTGALWFFEDLLTEYVRLRYEAHDKGVYSITKREKADLEDSFKRYFLGKKEKRQFNRLVDPFIKFYKNQTAPKKVVLYPFDQATNKKVYQIKGKLTPDNRPRIVNVQFDVKDTLQLAREMKVSLTIYLTAVYVLSVYQTSQSQKDQTTISVSIPINLRQFFPSATVRNFFSTTTVDYTFKKDKEPDLYDICQRLNGQFKKQMEKEAIEERLNQYVEFERNPLARVILRPIKDFVLKIINKMNNLKITVAMSNLGSLNLPDQMSKHVKDFYFTTSVIRPQFCMISYKDKLNVTFCSPFVETETYQYFINYLTKQGLKASVDVNRVTKEELGE